MFSRSSISQKKNRWSLPNKYKFSFYNFSKKWKYCNLLDSFSINTKISSKKCFAELRVGKKESIYYKGCRCENWKFFSNTNEYARIVKKIKKKSLKTLCQNPMKGGVGFYWKKRSIPPPCHRFLFFRQRMFFRIFWKIFKIFFQWNWL